MKKPWDMSGQECPRSCCSFRRPLAMQVFRRDLMRKSEDDAGARLRPVGTTAWHARVSLTLSAHPPFYY